MDIHPVIASILQAPVVQQQQAAEKAERLRRAKRTDASFDDELVHAVESVEKSRPVHDERDVPARRRKPTIRPDAADDGDDDRPHIDVTA